MHPHTTRLSSTDLPGGRPAEDPGAPLLSAVCVSPSSAASWIWSCEEQKKNSGDARQVENYWRQMPKLHTANLSTWRAPRNSENAAKTAKRPKYSEIDGKVSAWSAGIDREWRTCGT